MTSELAEFRWINGENGLVSIGAKQIEYVCHGPAPDTAPTIVLLHEGLGSVSLWRDFPQRLTTATGHGVLAYSRAGYGQSDPCDLPRNIDYMSEEAMQTLPQVLNTIGFRSGILLGHSDGATIAAIYSGMGGDIRVRGAVLIAPHFFTEAMGLLSIKEARSAFDRGGLREKLSRHHKNVDCAFRGWNDAWLDSEFTDWNVAEVIDYLRIPVLAIQGRDDQYGTLAQIEEMENRIYSPLDVEIIERCGHSPHIEQTERVLGLIADYAKRLQRIENVDVAVS